MEVVVQNCSKRTKNRKNSQRDDVLDDKGEGGQKKSKMPDD